MLTRRSLVASVIALVAARHGRVDAKKRRRKGKRSLVQLYVPNTRWSPNVQAIHVINHSHFAEDDVRAALNLWTLPGVPEFALVQAEQRSCDGISPQRGSVVFCTEPFINERVGARTRIFTNRPKWGKGKHIVRLRTKYIQAGIIGIVSMSSESRINTAAHEFGHALGLDHLNCTCVMEAVSDGKTKLAPEDIAALRRLYP